MKLGAAPGVDYHDPTWVDAAAATSGADGFDAAVNAAPGIKPGRVSPVAARDALAAALSGDGGQP